MFYVYLYILIGASLGAILAYQTLRREGWTSPDLVTAPLFVGVCAVLWPVIVWLSWRADSVQTREED